MLQLTAVDPLASEDAPFLKRLIGVDDFFYTLGSEAALKGLKDCLDKPSLRSLLFNSFQQEV